jgi:hypothetical protein
MLTFLTLKCNIIILAIYVILIVIKINDVRKSISLFLHIISDKRDYMCVLFVFKDGLISHQIVIVFHVHREKLDKELIYFSLEDQKDARLELHIEAKVLGVNQGTPLLRNGITLLHHGHQPHSSSTRKISNENIHFNIN